MPSLKPLALCLLSASLLPGLAIAETDEAIPRPSPAGQIEAPPAILDQAALVQITATVLAVDAVNRLVTLEGPKGQSATIKAGPEVRNFAQIAPGDKVTVDYYEAMTVDLVIPGGVKTDPGIITKNAEVRALPGEKPAGGVLEAITATIQILSVDPYKKAIAFRGLDGHYREISVKRPDLQHYLKDLKDGDSVQISYVEALAVAIVEQ